MRKNWGTQASKNWPLLTEENSKTQKGEKLGYLTGILYLAPSDESGVMNVCPMASPGCKAGCLFTAGRAQFTPDIIKGRIRKTRYLYNDRARFVAQLHKNIQKLVKRAAKLGLIPAVRINGTSDLPQLALQLATDYPDVQFYDYTKIPRPYDRIRANYHLTFSLSENNLPAALDALAHGVNVAVVFNVKRGHDLPTHWQGYTVIDGDMHDLRFLDKIPQGSASPVIVGLRAKGKAKKDSFGFVQIAQIGAL